MNRHIKSNSVFLLACCIVSMACGRQDGRADERPNVILIMSDDQGYGDFGATGNRAIQTPHIDAMAARSASMKHFYVSPVCSPTRACLMTGRYNYRTRCIDTWIGRSMMDTEEVTVAEALGSAGYRTGIFGKWHLGDCYPMRPNDQGFQESLVHKGGGLAQPSEPLENERRYTNPVLFHNGNKVQTTGYCTDVYFEAAIKFIKESQAQSKPFFAYIATNAPHGPFHDVPKKLLDRYRQKSVALQSIMTNKPAKLNAATDRLARIAAMITNIDDNVGKLFETLENLKISDNTLVILLVDNGPNSARYVGNVNGVPMRGVKNNVHEGGIRSPVWFHWPQGIENPPRSVNHLSAHIDIMPTILAACKVDPPKDRRLDGRNLLPLLEGKKVVWPERHIAIQSHRGNQPMRYHHFMITDGRWKLLHASGFHKQRFEGEPKFELYDLQQDPGELTNLVDKNRSQLVRLKQEYDKWFDDVSSTRKDNYAPPRIVIGSKEQPRTTLTRQDWRAMNWGNQSIGTWKIRVDDPGVFKITILLAKKEKVSKASVRVGPKFENKMDGRSTNRIVIDRLPLKKGEHDMSVVLEIEGKPRGPYQVIVERNTQEKSKDL